MTKRDPEVTKVGPGFVFPRPKAPPGITCWQEAPAVAIWICYNTAFPDEFKTLCARTSIVWEKLVRPKARFGPEPNIISSSNPFTVWNSLARHHDQTIPHMYVRVTHFVPEADHGSFMASIDSQFRSEWKDGNWISAYSV